MTTSSPVKAKLPLILRKDNHLCLAVYDEAAADVVELNGSTNRYTGDYREAEVRMNPAHPRCFAHATTTHVRYSEVIEKEDGTPSLHLHFEVEMSYVVVELAFSPLGTYLLAYAMMDTKRTPDGNLSVIEVATGRVVRRCLQARWPAMVWSAMEEYVVRPAQGCLHIMNGNMSGSTSSPTEVEVMNDADAKEDEHNDDDDDAEGGEAPTPAPSSGVLCKLELMLAQDKEIVFSTSPNDALPILALFKPFYKQRQGVFSLYRLPHLQEGPLFQLQFGRSEEAQMLWSPSGKYIALQVKSERDPSGKSYYGITTLHIIDVMNRSVKDIKLNKGEGESIHDCQWAPNSDELLVVHGKMPRNKTTLLDRHGVALLTFSESPRNMACWSPDGKQLALGGSGNLAGHYAFFTRPTSSSPSNAKNGTASSANAATMAAPDCTGELEEKCSLSTWAPDSHHFLCSTVFTRLRMDNKIIIAKNNGQRMCTKKYDLLYGAEWVEMQKPEMYPRRPPSPRQVVEKAAAYRPPGGGSTRTAELFRRPDAGAAPTAKRAGPVGGAVVMKKKKR